MGKYYYPSRDMFPIYSSCANFTHHSFTGASDKKYTFILKDTLLPPNPENGREQSTISYEYDFRVDSPGTSNSDSGGDPPELAAPVTVYIPWNEFKPTYRGKEQGSDAPRLNYKGVKRFSLMMRR